MVISTRQIASRAFPVFIADTAVVAPEAIGQKLTAIMRITLETVRPDVVDSFKRAMADRPEVLQCYNSTGSADFVVILFARDVQDFDRISRCFFEQNRHVGRLDIAQHIRLRTCSPENG